MNKPYALLVALVVAAFVAAAIMGQDDLPQVQPRPPVAKLLWGNARIETDGTVFRSCTEMGTNGAQLGAAEVGMTWAQFLNAIGSTNTPAGAAQAYNKACRIKYIADRTP